MFECLLAYARREGGVGLNWLASPRLQSQCWNPGHATLLLPTRSHRAPV